MIANNIFRLIADFCTNVLFIPFDALRNQDRWWISNTFNIVLVSIGGILFLYWLVQLQIYKKAGTD
jgi:hypothetical protein